MTEEKLSGLEAYWRRRWSETDSNILAVAKSLFLEKGFSTASMVEVARIADVSTATLYKHFTSKDDLFGACVETMIELGEDEQSFLALVARKELSAIQIPDTRVLAIQALKQIEVVT